MDPKRWAAQLPVQVPDSFHPSASSDSAQNRSYSVADVHDWPFAADSTAGLEEASNVFAEDLRELQVLDDMLTEGAEWIYRLYGLRSISRAVPQVDDEATKDDIHRCSFDLLRPRVTELLQLINFAERTVQQFCKSASFLMQPARRKRTLPKAVLSRMVALVDVIVTLDHLKDMKTQIKNDFSAFKRAFAYLKGRVADKPKSAASDRERAEMNALSGDVERLQQFLSDARYPTAALSSNLKRALHSVPGDHSEIMADLIAFCLTELESERFLLPEEKFRMIRFIPHALYLTDYAGNDKQFKPCNAFKHKRIELSRIKPVFMRYPVCPLFADMHITIIYVLEKCPNFQAMLELNPAVVTEWGGVLPVDVHAVQPGEKTDADKKLEEDKRNYELAYHWRDIRREFDDFSCRFVSCARRVRADAADSETQGKRASDAAVFAARPDAPEPADARRRRVRSEALDREVYEVTLEGLKLLGKWKEKILAQMAFKFSKGVELDHQGSKRFTDYDRVVQLNHTPLELIILFDVVSTIKSLTGLMAKYCALFAMPIRRRIHQELQEFAQLRLLRMAHNAHKKKKANVSVLLQLRTICLDWFPTANNPNDYKEKKTPRRVKEFEKKSGLGEDPADAEEGPQTTSSVPVEEDRYLLGPSRAVGPSPTQLCLLRSFVEMLRDPDKSDSFFSSISSFFSSADIDSTQAIILKDFYNRSFFYPYLLGLETSIRDTSELSFLWHREFYLEMSKQVQFPISSSLPWIVLKEVLEGSGSNAPMIESVLLFLDVYNDAAQFALVKLKQGFLFDEVEAEGKLVFEQFVFLLAHTLYTHYKNVNAGRILDKSYRLKLQELRSIPKSTSRNPAAFLTALISSGNAKGGKRSLEVDHKRYTALLSEQAFQFLGRTIDLSKFVADNINMYIREDLELVFKRFEISGMSSSQELESLLTCVRNTHSDLAQVEHLVLDNFHLLIEQVDERVSGGGNPRTRLAQAAADELMQIMSNYCYCAVSDRFIRSPSAAETKKKQPPSGPPNFLYGKRFKEAFQRAHALQSEFIGAAHFHALLRCASFGNDDANPLSKHVAAYLGVQVVEGCLRVLEDLVPLLEVLGKQLGSASRSQSQQQQHFSGATAYQAFDFQVKQAGVTHSDERNKVVRLLREFGNGLVILRFLHLAVDQLETESFIQTCHLTGLDSLVATSGTSAALSVDLAPAILRLPQSASKEEELFVADQVSLNINAFRGSGLMQNAYRMLLDAIRKNDAYKKSLDNFPRVFNYLQFSYASTAGGLQTSVPAKEDDETVYGEGFLWSGNFLLFALNAKAKFELIDLCAHVARADLLERCWKSDEGSMKEQAASSNLNPFLKCVRETIEPAKALVFSSLSRLFPDIPDLERGNEQQSCAGSLVLFHPPGGFFDEVTGQVRDAKFAEVANNNISTGGPAPVVRRGSASSSSFRPLPTSPAMEQAALPPPPRMVSVSLDRPAPPPRAGSLDNLGPAPPPPSRITTAAPAPPPRVTSAQGEIAPPLPPRELGAAPPPPPRTMSMQTMVGGAAPPPPPRTMSMQAMVGTGAPPPPPLRTMSLQAGLVAPQGVEGNPPPPPPRPTRNATGDETTARRASRPPTDPNAAPTRPPRARTGD